MKTKKAEEKIKPLGPTLGTPVGSDRMTTKERDELKNNNLLKPGEDPGEGYKGAPDMYPDYEEDKKERKKSKMNYGGSTNKYKSGSYVQVKTKLAKTKPCKLC